MPRETGGDVAQRLARWDRSLPFRGGPRRWWRGEGKWQRHVPKLVRSCCPGAPWWPGSSPRITAAARLPPTSPTLGHGVTITHTEMLERRDRPRNCHALTLPARRSRPHPPPHVAPSAAPRHREPRAAAPRGTLCRAPPPGLALRDGATGQRRAAAGTSGVDWDPRAPSCPPGCRLSTAPCGSRCRLGPGRSRCRAAARGRRLPRRGVRR